MTALPLPPESLDRLLSIEEYAALGEIEHGRYELQEGRLLMSPSPRPDHMIATVELAFQLKAQLPAGLRLVPDVDLDLELAAPGKPGWSRRPDLVIVTGREVERVRQEGGLLRASQTLVVVAVVSPGSERTDHVIKREDYADAGIPRYWIIDLDAPVTLLDCQLAGEFGYQDPGSRAGKFETTVVLDDESNFPVRIDLDELLA